MKADHLRNLRQLQVGILQQQFGLFDSDTADIIGEIDAVFLLEFAGDIFTADVEFAGHFLQRQVGWIILFNVFHNFRHRVALLHRSGRKLLREALQHSKGPVAPGEQREGIAAGQGSRVQCICTLKLCQCAVCLSAEGFPYQPGTEQQGIGLPGIQHLRGNDTPAAQLLSPVPGCGGQHLRVAADHRHSPFLLHVGKDNRRFTSGICRFRGGEMAVILMS
ncbi:hypothetical protein D3C73_1222060 [compost metagenome]